MNTMGSDDTAAARSCGHNFVTGDDRRQLARRHDTTENAAEEALSAAKGVARKARSWLLGSPLLTLALVVGAGFLLSRLFESRD
jgi:hypothetical protein